MSHPFSRSDLNNIHALLDFGFQNGIVKAQDDAKVLLLLAARVDIALEELGEEDTDGDDVPAGDQPSSGEDR